MKPVLAGSTRREVFVSALRCTALGAVMGAGGFMLAKRRRLVAEGVCINNEMCRDCVALADCGLPAVLSMRENERKGNHGRSK